MLKAFSVLAFVSIHTFAQLPAQRVEPKHPMVMLWPAGAPGALGNLPEDQPAITVYLPASNPTKTGVIVVPGGGYSHLAIAKEGFAIADWLNQHGIAAFVLRYRLGPAYHHPIELGDAQRALRMVRAQSETYGILPSHLGMMGFSAGGHLTATAGTHFDAGDGSATDPIDRESSRPDFLILAYPVITLKAPYVHQGSLHSLLGETPDPAMVDTLSDDQQVTAHTPPTFLYATTDDPVVPVMNSVLFYEALLRANVPAEIHIFQHGSHGSGLGGTNQSLMQWPNLLYTWLQVNGFAQ
jgi:acetyl esterase/lipase